MNIIRSYTGIIFLILFLSAFVGGLWWWFRPSQNDQYSNPSAQYYKDLEKRYAEDTYGGATPEETLQLFIAALEAGNIDLASKYFVIEKQEDQAIALQKVEDAEFLNKMITDLKRKKFKSIKNKNQVTFSIANDNNEIALTILLSKIPNSKWKIQSL